jgi:O-antigen ligase
VSQILLGAALLALLVSRRPLFLPPQLGWPLAAFGGWTLLATAFSSDPAAGLPQVRKLLVLLTVLVICNAFRSQSQLWHTIQAVVVAGGVAAGYGLVQFARDYWRIQREGLPFYDSYVVHQITGFMSHWMTFSGELMLILVLLASLLMFGDRSLSRPWGWSAAGMIALALLASFTRGIWLAVLSGLTYLIYSYRKWIVLFIPAGVLLLFLLSPSWLQHRQASILQPAADSSSMSRIVMARTGLAMIAAHPIFGLGPERVSVEFPRYAPPETALPAAWYGHLHNTFLQIAAERGIPCLIILLWIFLNVLRDGQRQAAQQADQRLRALGAAAVAGTTVLMVGGLFEYNFGDSEVLMLYLFVASLPFAWQRCTVAPPPVSA